MNTFSDSFYGIELGLPLLLLLSSPSDWLAPYCSFTLLAGHNYLAGIQNYFFFTSRTIEATVHLTCPTRNGIAQSLSSVLCGVVLQGLWSPSVSVEPGTHVPICTGNSKWPYTLFEFCFSFLLDDRSMGFPDSSCLFFDLIPFVYLLS